MPNTRKDPDSPLLTEEFFRNAKPFRERFPNVDPSEIKVMRVHEDGTRDVIENPGKTDVPLSSELVQKLRDTGPEWVNLAEDILRTGLEKHQSKAA